MPLSGPGTNYKWDGTPLLITFFDTWMMHVGLYLVLNYLLWQALWPCSQSIYKPWWTLSAMGIVLSLRLVVVDLWPKSTSQYLEKSSDYIQQCLTVLGQRVEKVKNFPPEVSVDIANKIRPMVDESERLNDKLHHTNLGFIWIWWAARRLYYKTGYFHLELKSRAFSYSLKIHMEDLRPMPQEAQNSQSGMHESHDDEKVHSTAGPGPFQA